MLKYANFDIVFQEVPDEVTLAINISNCPNQCVGCHSQYLWKDVGYVLDKESLDELVAKYRTGITCVCFMGGDAEPYDVANLAMYVKNKYKDIKSWENYLYGNGYRIVKLFLNLSKDEQKKRFLERIDRKEKNWKRSDELRDALAAAGYLVKDTPQGQNITKA